MLSVVKIVANKLIGTKIIYGTECEVRDQLLQVPGISKSWLVVRGLCAGIPDSCTEYPTLSSALEVFGVDERE